jgi:hypothetical protein
MPIKPNKNVIFVLIVVLVYFISVLILNREKYSNSYEKYATERQSHKISILRVKGFTPNKLVKHIYINHLK